MGSETLSHFTSKKDYRTAVLFGDGAGAVVVERSGQDHHGIIDVVWHANGNDTDLVIPAGGSRQPLTAELLADDKHMIQMDDKRVFGFAIAVCANVIEALMKRNDLTWPDVDWIVPHQANKRIIEAVARRLDVPLEKFIINIHQYGNTSSASIPIALAEAVNNGVIQRGDRVLLAAFGAGFTWGGCYLVWGR